jgi:hypothetical protein
MYVCIYIFSYVYMFSHPCDNAPTPTHPRTQDHVSATLYISLKLSGELQNQIQPDPSQQAPLTSCDGPEQENNNSSSRNTPGNHNVGSQRPPLGSSGGAARLALHLEAVEKNQGSKVIESVVYVDKFDMVVGGWLGG